MVLRDLRRRAEKRTGEPLDPEDWAAVWELNTALHLKGKTNPEHCYRLSLS